MKKLPSVEHVETLSLSAMRKLVGGFVGQMHELQAEVAELRAENKNLRDKVAGLALAFMAMPINSATGRFGCRSIRNILS